MRIFILLSLTITTLLLFSSFSHVLCEEEEEDLSFLEEPDNEHISSAHHHHHDHGDVVVLNGKNFGDMVKNNRYVLVEFYALWCGPCKALAPEYAAAATELKGENVILAKVDVMHENKLSKEYDIHRVPTIYFFIDGVHKTYNGQRNKKAIVNWIKKKTGPGIHNITTLDDAERILTSKTKDFETKIDV